MASHPDLFAGVLVGGRGKRMGGRDKARLKRADGVTFIDHILGALDGLVSEVVLAAGPGHSYGDLGHRVVEDRFVGAGPLAGLEALLAEPAADWCFLVACDLPYFDPAVLTSLVGARKTGKQIVVPRTADGLQPTCALYAADVYGAICDMLDDGDRKLVNLLERAPVVEVDLPGELARALWNVNRTEDLPGAK